MTTFQKGQHIYFIGIGGISMSGLAEILADKGCIVSGTDIKESPVTKHLQNLGIHINFGHKAENITDDVDLVVYTAAIHPDNPEYQAAQAKHIPLMDRARLLGEIMAEYEDSIAVAGTHGKTTTTSMVSEILLAAGTDPTITVGGILPTISSNLKIGHSPYFVAEACEYFDSFLQFKPFVGVILNVESDHLDYFKNLANIRRSFHAFAERIPAKGALVINQAIENVAELTQGLDCTVETFGLADGADWQAKNIIHEPDGKNTFDVYYKGELFGNFHLNVPGDHNITNAVASIAAAHFVGVCPADCQKGLLHFTGTERRFQKKAKKTALLSLMIMRTTPQKSRRHWRRQKRCSTVQPGAYSSRTPIPERSSSLMHSAKHSPMQMKSSLRISMPQGNPMTAPFPPPCLRTESRKQANPQDMSGILMPSAPIWRKTARQGIYF